MRAPIRTTTPLLALACTLILALAPHSASAQTQNTNDLRRENDVLRDRNARLTAQLNEARRRIADLERENEQLKEQLAGGAPQPATPAQPAAPGTTPAAPEPEKPDLAPLPQSPYGAPEALLHALAESYRERITDPLPITDTERRRYLGQVNRWARSIPRQLRGPAEWTIELIAISEGPGPFTITFRAVDPTTHKPYGDLTMRQTLTGRFRRDVENNPGIPYWNLKGTVIAKPVVNERRAEKGLINNPPFIAPYAEWNADLTIQSLEPQPTTP